MKTKKSKKDVGGRVVMVSDLEMDMRQMKNRVLALECRVHELESELNRRASRPKDYNWI